MSIQKGIEVRWCETHNQLVVGKNDHCGCEFSEGCAFDNQDQRGWLDDNTPDCRIVPMVLVKPKEDKSMSDYSRDLGERLRQARKRAGLSLDQLQTKTGGEFKASVVGAYERGQRAITVERLHGLCVIYGIHPVVVIPV